MRIAKMLLVASAIATPIPAVAQTDYPSKPIRLIVPFTPGGGNDVLARALADRMQRRWGQPVIVENKPGAGGNIGAEAVARSTADGYTLLLATNTIAIAPHIGKVTYDIRSDFTPIARVASTPFLLLVNPAKLPVNSVGDLIAYAKANPGGLSYGSVGVGTPHHLGMELFKSLTKIDIIHVPYRGSAPALFDLIGGQTQLMLATSNVAMPVVEKNELRALGVAERKRIASLPNIPTIAEAGVADFEVTTWYGVLAPAGTPVAVQQKLAQATLEILNEEEVRARLIAAGFEIAPAEPAEVQRLLLTDFEKWGTIVRGLGLKPQ